MGERRVVDLSRFLLFEAGGDSEADLDPNMVSFGLMGDQGNAYKGNGDEDDDDDDDDAESCSNDVGYCPSSHIRDVHVNVDVDDDDDDGERNEIHGIDDHRYHHQELEGEEMVSEVASTANSYASRKCVRSSRKMSEIDKSRLFWEACLAS